MGQRNNTAGKAYDHLPGEDICWVGYLYPFTMIVPDGEVPLAVPLEEINNNSYNHGQLCRIVGSTQVADLPGLDILICYDGAIALPAAEKYSKKSVAVNYFNFLFACLLLGDLQIEAVDTRDLVTGTLHESRLIWPVGFGESASSHMHAKLRMRLGNSIDNIILSNPRHIYLSSFKQKMTFGAQIFATVRNLTPTFLITGFTELKYNNWSTALSNLWICIEQLTDFLWKEKMLPKSRTKMKAYPSRVKSMKEDSRTWSMSIKHELLFQNGIISEDIYGLIFPARQARNKLVHEGQSIPENIAVGVSTAVLSLIATCIGAEKTDLSEIVLRNFGYGNHFTDGESSFTDWCVLSQKIKKLDT